MVEPEKSARVPLIIEVVGEAYYSGKYNELVNSLVNVVGKYLCQPARACYRYSHHVVFFGEARH